MFPVEELGKQKINDLSRIPLKIKGKISMQNSLGSSQDKVNNPKYFDKYEKKAESLLDSLLFSPTSSSLRYCHRYLKLRLFNFLFFFYHKNHLQSQR